MAYTGTSGASETGIRYTGIEDVEALECWQWHTAGHYRRYLCGYIPSRYLSIDAVEYVTLLSRRISGN